MGDCNERRTLIMYKILIVDDDIHIGNMLEEILTREGYRVSRAYSGTEALLAIGAYSPDLILLDLMLPGMSGEEVMAAIKNIPVRVVSAKADTDSKTDLLLGGAADYVTKPFDTRELLARIVARLRKSPENISEILTFSDITLDTASHCVCCGDNSVHLTRTEYAILKLLMKKPSSVITKSAILDLISLDTPDCTEDSLKTHISNLRRKLRAICGRDCIEAVWGIGFRLTEN